MARLKKLKLFIATMAIIVVSASNVLVIPNGPELTTNWVGIDAGCID